MLIYGSRRRMPRLLTPPLDPPIRFAVRYTSWPGHVLAPMGVAATMFAPQKRQPRGRSPAACAAWRVSTSEALRQPGPAPSAGEMLACRRFWRPLALVFSSAGSLGDAVLQYSPHQPGVTGKPTAPGRSPGRWASARGNAQLSGPGRCPLVALREMAFRIPSPVS